jgi:chemotaxis protein MotA
MDKLSLFGVLVAFGGIIGGQLLEGGTASVLLQSAAFFIVFGGTLGAVMLQHPVHVFINGLKMGRWAFFTPKMDMQNLAYQLTAWSSLARKEGLLMLEGQTKNVEDPFIVKALQLLVDGNGADKIREVLEVDVGVYEESCWQGARVWEAAAGYSPTIGIMGAVLGLIHVMQSLGDPSKLGEGIAVAFIATIYGVGFANLVFLPIAGKLKAITMKQLVMREMVIDGMVMIANLESPRFIENKLKGYIS